MTSAASRLLKIITRHYRKYNGKPCDEEYIINSFEIKYLRMLNDFKLKHAFCELRNDGYITFVEGKELFLSDISPTIKGLTYQENHMKLIIDRILISIVFPIIVSVVTALITTLITLYFKKAI